MAINIKVSDQYQGIVEVAGEPQNNTVINVNEVKRYDSVLDMQTAAEFGSGVLQTSDKNAFYVSNGRSYNKALLGRNANLVGIRNSDAYAARNPFNIQNGVRTQPTLPTITSIIFIDPSAKSDGSGTYASPWRLTQLPADFSGSWTNNTAYLFKRGTDFNLKVQTTANNVLFSSYGTGPMPIWRNNGDRCLHADGANTMISHISFWSNGAKTITNNTAVANTTARNLTIYSCFITVPGIYGTTAGGKSAVFIGGSGNKILLCKLDDIADDAIWCSGNDLEVAYCHIDNVGTSSAILGDCVQLAINANNPWIHHNFLRNPLGWKQCIEHSVTGATLATFEYNYIDHVYEVGADSKAIKSKASGLIVRRNVIKAGTCGIWCEDSATVESNIITLDDPAGLGGAAGIDMVLAGGTYTIQNNTIVSPQRKGLRAMRYAWGTAPGVGSVIKNNIIQGFRGTAIESVATTGWTIDYNCFFDNVTNTNYPTLGTHNLFHDPLLDVDFVPQDLIVQNLGTTGAANDLYGTAFIKSLGAIQADAADYDDTAGAVYWAINGQ